ncbi:stage II sporulation protein R [Paenibacillus pasadenensis]|uniref:stage II sporulation protein R n=1 Tax=Paenibacillus pasadenensis TaxID=217090 RepID=UPI00203B22C5|nr:stage II sporulation protein R [Paenibacillus pasadenensis]MCM3747613.1 stage II sporulation protein R [Paenibacillus pasadenensis]
MLGSSYSSVSYSYVSVGSASSAVRRPYSAAPHVYRMPFRMSYLYLLVCLAVLVMSWESARNDAAIAQGEIPNEAIRLRILANSDSAVDQATKRVVRDAIVAEMNSWANEAQTIEEARIVIQSRMGEIEAVVAERLQARGFSYGFKAELGMAEFPTKVYGEKVYPAGDYEALRITLGEGKGQNWWCVLFPPLCFVDSATGEAVPKAEAAAASGDGAAVQASAAVDGGAKDKAGAAEAGQAPEAKFFIWELIESLLGFLRGLFA